MGREFLDQKTVSRAAGIVPFHGFIEGTGKFPIQKYAIFGKFKKIKGLRGGVLLYTAQAIPPIDAEIAGKGHLWTETGLMTCCRRKTLSADSDQIDTKPIPEFQRRRRRAFA